MSEKFKKIIENFTKLPGIGPRHAARLVLALMEWPADEVISLANSISGITVGSPLCRECFNFADDGLCDICKNPRRNQLRIAVVERVTDLASIEKSDVYDGVYHVLGGAINPVNGVLPEKLKIRELIKRARNLPENGEIILATNPNTYGDTTALYLEQELASLQIKVTRLARGLASGTSVEYADEITLTNALKHRK